VAAATKIVMTMYAVNMTDQLHNEDAPQQRISTFRR
jgi:hypothetical protein